MPKMAILGQKWSFLAILRGLHGVTWPETIVCQRSTPFSHNIQNSVIYNEKWKNGGQKGFAMPYVNVPLFYQNWVAFMSKAIALFLSKLVWFDSMLG